MGAIWRRVTSAPSGLPDDAVYGLRSNKYYIALHEGLKRKWAPAFFALLFVYLGATFASHLLYNVQDVAGWTCVEDGTASGLAKGEKREVDFATSNLCNRTGIAVEGNGAKYHIAIKATSQWRDDGIPSQLGGFYSTDAPGWYQRVLFMLGVPLRRAPAFRPENKSSVSKSRA